MAAGFDGVRFGPYILHTLLGQGSYAKVFMATRRDDQSVLALKVLHDDLTGEGDALSNLKDEENLGSWLSHPNIVDVRKLKKVGRYWCLEMEFVDGFTLDELLYRESTIRGNREEKPCRFKDPLPPSVVIDIALQICMGLKCAHTTTAGSSTGIGLIHRDLKPANIMVTRDGVVKIADLGTAKFEQSLRISPMTQVGATRGSPAYMSPEQVSSGRDVDQRSDIFSFGSILAEVLLYDQVFNADGLGGILRLLAFSDTAKISGERVREVAPAFEHLIRLLHANKAEERMQSVQEVIDTLKLIGMTVSGPTLREWLEVHQKQIPRSKPLNEWGRDGRPEEVLRLDDLRQTGMFSAQVKAVSRSIQVVQFDPEDDEPEGDLDEDIRPTVQDLVVWSTSLDVQPIEPPTELAVPKVVPKPDLSVSIGDADFGAETADWSSIPSVGAKTDDWTAMPAGEPDDMSSLVAETEDAGEEPGLRIASLILAIAFFSMISMLLWIFATPRSPELRVDLEPTPAPDLDLATPEPTPEMTIEPMSATPAPTPVPTSRSTPAPTPRVVEREMPIVEPRRVSISEVETPSAAPEPSGTLDTATLIVSTTPPSVVWLDGNKLGVTSEQIEYQITAGPHRIRLECIGPKCPEGAGLIRENIDPGPGEEVTLLRKFKSPLQ